ncbi:hypothetical protein ALC60_00208 [Trachymyrmex zeteki]|uniref:Uncharacterized protein n=1 Tax=Mycetomoellerius zeteki TaxID=64791 RepID=A0A151XKA6_9HYME|nr:hypothetical protein ALC60_00208 [Trachymyrmex zeteki]
MKSGVTVTLDQTRVSPQWDVIAVFYDAIVRGNGKRGKKNAGRR